MTGVFGLRYPPGTGIATTPPRNPIRLADRARAGGTRMGGLFGGNGPLSGLGMGGQYGAWPGCGCSGCLMVVAGVILVFAGGLRWLGF